MPGDRYRNQGPDDSHDYRAHLPPKTNDFSDDLKALIIDGRRADGRSSDELRPIYLMPGIFEAAKGSAYIEVGNTKVVVMVSEPVEIPRLSHFKQHGELRVDVTFATFATRTRKNPSIANNEEKDMAHMLKTALLPAICRSEFPNFQVQINVSVLENDGSCFAAALNAAGAALANAGIHMFDTIAAVQLGLHNDEIFVDPTLDEEEFCTQFYKNKTKQMGLMNISYLPTIKQYSCSKFSGCCLSEQFVDHLDLMTNCCQKISKIITNKLASGVINQLDAARQIIVNRQAMA